MRLGEHRGLLKRRWKTVLPTNSAEDPKYGMVTLDDAIMDMLNKKMISPEDAYDKANDKNKFKPLLKTPPDDWA